MKIGRIFGSNCPYPPIYLKYLLFSKEVMKSGLFKHYHYRHDRESAQRKVEHIVQHPAADRQEVCHKEADIQADMAEAHENYRVFAHIFEHTAHKREAAQIFKPAEEIYPEEHCDACIQMRHRDIAPHAVAQVWYIVADDADIVQHGNCEIER